MPTPAPAPEHRADVAGPGDPRQQLLRPVRANPAAAEGFEPQPLPQPPEVLVAQASERAQASRPLVTVETPTPTPTPTPPPPPPPPEPEVQAPQAAPFPVLELGRRPGDPVPGLSMTPGPEPAAAPAPPPSPGPAPQAPPPAPPDAQATYTVRAGDTLGSIAQSRYGSATAWQAIASANPLVDPTRLRVGQTLRMPELPSLAATGERTDGDTPATLPPPTPAVSHRVRSGDALSTLAARYYGDSSRWRVIFNANRGVIGDNPNALRVGMELEIPPKPPS